MTETLLTYSLAYGQINIISRKKKVCKYDPKDQLKKINKTCLATKCSLPWISSIKKKTQIFFISVGNVGYSSVYICQNSFDGTLKAVHFTVYKLHLKRKNKPLKHALVRVM